jgi:hypothetical protein
MITPHFVGYSLLVGARCAISWALKEQICISHPPWNLSFIALAATNKEVDI